MKKQFVFVFCILVPVLGHAEPTVYFKFGWAPFYGPNLTVDDSDGSTDSSQEFVALSAVAMFLFGRDNRWMTNITKYDAFGGIIFRAACSLKSSLYLGILHPLAAPCYSTVLQCGRDIYPDNHLACSLNARPVGKLAGEETMTYRRTQ